MHERCETRSSESKPVRRRGLAVPARNTVASRLAVGDPARVTCREVELPLDLLVRDVHVLARGAHASIDDR